MYEEGHQYGNPLTDEMKLHVQNLTNTRCTPTTILTSIKKTYLNFSCKCSPNIQRKDQVHDRANRMAGRPSISGSTRRNRSAFGYGQG